MSLILYKAFAAIIILIATVIAVAYPIQKRSCPHHHRFFELGDALASGIFLGVALFHMLPEAIQDFNELNQSSHLPYAEFFCAGGFVFLLFLERLSLNSIRLKPHLAIPYVIAITLMIHSLIEGAALGVNTEFATVSAIFFAIIVHKCSESFALSVALCRGNHIPISVLWWIVGTFALMTPLGILLGSTMTAFLAFKQGIAITAGFNAFAAGTFLYMATLHHIHLHRNHVEAGLSEFFSLLLGLGMMGLIVIWV